MPKKIIFTQDEIAEIISLHDNNMTNEEIGKIFKVSKSTIARLLTSLKIPSKHPKLTKKRKNRICECYLNGMSFFKISKLLHCSQATAKLVILESGIEPKDTRKYNQKYSINETYFNNIDTPNKAYILGLLFADGSVSKNKTNIALSLQQQDVDILHKIKKEIGSSHPLIYIPYNSKNEKWSDQFSFAISNKCIHDDLIMNGVTPNKSYNAEFPYHLNPELYRRFIRGYLDGDGSILKNIKEKRVSIIGTESFCKSIKGILKDELDIHCSISACHGNFNSVTKDLRISGGKQVKKFLDWIYKDAELYLNRKYDIYVKIYKQ